MEYQETDYEYDQNPSGQSNNSIKGLKIAIVILIIILAAISFRYWQQVQELKGNEADLIVERDTITNRLEALMGEYGAIKFDNDTLNQNLALERHKADSLVTRLKKERSLSLSKLKKYEKELSTLRTTMRGFVRQIDSLSRLNQKLVGENIKYRKEISTYKTRTEMAEETATELNQKVQRGSVIKARDITLRAMRKNNKEASKARQAERLVVGLTLAANDLAKPAERTVYVRIISPDGYDMVESANTMFSFEGQMIPFTASRMVDYQGDDLNVSVYYNGGGLIPGKYTVLVYMDGFMVGSNEIILK